MNPKDDAASTTGREHSSVASPAKVEDSVFKAGVHIPPFWPELLTQQVASLQANQLHKSHFKYNRSPHNRERRSSAHRHRSRSQSSAPNSNYYWYYKRFGVKANKCDKPCNFAIENYNGSRK
ncbi:unnamed protein product [Euphydryas editha]|uniref:Uncharacterized protein n=1 Tax=Euphydryas editha TaxID=104508 RepID=A0AAU9VAI2_EUPED|nr:unnamed protein product [Euphydryas editha]